MLTDKEIEDYVAEMPEEGFVWITNVSPQELDETVERMRREYGSIKIGGELTGPLRTCWVHYVGEQYSGRASGLYVPRRDWARWFLTYNRNCLGDNVRDLLNRKLSESAILSEDD